MKKLILLIVSAIIYGTFTINAEEPTDILTLPQSINELKLQRNTGHFLYVSGGPGLILTEVEMGHVTSGQPNFSGVINVGYEWISQKKFGFGVLYNGYFTGVDCTESSGMTIMRIHDRWGLHYFSLQLAGRILLKSPKWSLRYALGLGFVASRDIAMSQGERLGINYDYGYGTNTSFGAEFMLSKRISITGGVKLFDASVKQSFFGETNDAGVIRIDVDFGLSFRF